MASVTQALTPPAGMPQQGTPPATADEFGARQGRWMSWLARPEVRAGLAQFGASMLQPVAPGQSFGGHLGLSVADAAAATGRSAAFQQEQTQAASQEARAQRGEARAEKQISLEERQITNQEAAGRRAEVKAERDVGLEERRLKLEEKKAASLDNYYRMIGGRIGTAATKDPILEKKLDLLQEWSLLEDDPIAAFDQGLQRMGIKTGAAVTEGGVGTSTLPRVGSPQEAAKLPSGTRFLDPNGVERIVP